LRRRLFRRRGCHDREENEARAEALFAKKTKPAPVSDYAQITMKHHRYWHHERISQSSAKFFES
jgi:hypothetical protein